MFLGLNMTDISVIIPLAPGEAAWYSFLDDLTGLQVATEIILVTSCDITSSDREIIFANKNIRFLQSDSGRAIQMNAGAKDAKGKYLWFLHADSKFGLNTVPALLKAIENYPDRLLYFNLSFLKDGTFWMFINSWGAYFRSRILKTPFGDQGFCIKKELFNNLGGFPDNLIYGEDHVFVWKVRQSGIIVQPISAVLYTSARKYKKNGWLKTTFIHQYLWIKQAWPQWLILRKKMKERRYL
jgi:rSAM/selenodomain-associated transferase 2